jgi:hypothetical protein
MGQLARSKALLDGAVDEIRERFVVETIRARNRSVLRVGASEVRPQPPLVVGGAHVPSAPKYSHVGKHVHM